MPLHMLFLFFLKKENQEILQMLHLCIHANINHASAHCSPKNEGMRGHIVVKKKDFKDFFFFLQLSSNVHSVHHITQKPVTFFVCAFVFSCSL